ncbi:peptidoglycan DD-metalloendopeptidase family protein [bacterium]|nr:peptidoglycan DD-metalloendopeptidase family protein [bacterium]
MMFRGDRLRVHRRLAHAGRRAALAALLVAAPMVLNHERAAAQRDSYTLDDLKSVEAARDEAQKRLRALERSSASAERETAEIDADLIAAASDSRRREEAAAAAEVRLETLNEELKTARERMVSDRRALDDLLAALMSLGSRRPPALATSPEDTGDAVRAAILMGETAPALKSRADELATRIEDLRRIASQVDAERDLIADSVAALAARRAEIEALAAEKRLKRASLAAETAALSREAERLGREAATLKELLKGLQESAPGRPSRKPSRTDEARPSANPSQTAARDRPNTRGTARPPPAATSSGVALKPTAPVFGEVLVRYGRSRDGVAAQGVTFAARPGAQVVSPLDARIEYAGAFRSYGDVLILDVGDDYLVVLAGLDAIYPETGQWVLAGEPVGRMADRATPPPEFYLEVRRNGDPVDPEGWLEKGA